jgi:hypothetical protein
MDNPLLQNDKHKEYDLGQYENNQAVDSVKDVSR